MQMYEILNGIGTFCTVAASVASAYLAWKTIKQTKEQHRRERLERLIDYFTNVSESDVKKLGEIARTERQITQDREFVIKAAEAALRRIFRFSPINFSEADRASYDGALKEIIEYIDGKEARNTKVS
jgi:Asp-tRNA(Asn)/Glu-tRNA(Gln) amidotransferase C subunit